MDSSYILPPQGNLFGCGCHDHRLGFHYGLPAISGGRVHRVAADVERPAVPGSAGVPRM